MTINQVPGLPLKAGRHLTAWIVWHTVRVSMIEDGEPMTPARPERSKRSRRRTKK